MSFRERLSALIDEHEALVASYESLLAEKETLRNIGAVPEVPQSSQPSIKAHAAMPSRERSNSSLAISHGNAAASGVPSTRRNDRRFTFPPVGTLSSQIGGRNARQSRKQRCVVMKRLGMLDQCEETDDTSSMSVEEEARYEEILNDLWVKFNRMDTRGESALDAKQLQIYFNRKRGETSEGSLHTIEHIANMLKAVNLASGYVPSTATEEQLHKIKFPSFVEMMLMDDIHRLEAKDVELVRNLRRMFLTGTATAAIANSMGISSEALHDGPQTRTKSSWLELVVGVVIMLNAVTIGMSADVQPLWSGWIYFEIFFTVFFTGELLYKLRLLGIREYFLGDDIFWNSFDSLLVLVAVVDLAITSFAEQLNLDLRSITMIRIVRLARLTRIVRLLHLKIFKELLLMVKGIFVGMRTLIWAILLLLSLIYCIGVLLKLTIGSETSTRWEGCGATANVCAASATYIRKHRDQLFSTVFRSMFTVFRCFLDGCSAPDGTPLMVHAQNVYGPMAVVFYVLVVLFVTFGLFNLIMAIFFENTLEAARSDEARRQQARKQEYLRSAQKLRELIMEFCQPLTSNKTAVLHIDEAMFEHMVSEPRVIQMLDDLDINVPNKKDLFEVLDADQSGHIDLRELVQGLMKLRGSASKTDAVATLLTVRSLQRSTKVSEVYLMRQLASLRASVSELSKVVYNLGDPNKDASMRRLTSLQDSVSELSKVVSNIGDQSQGASIERFAQL